MIAHGPLDVFRHVIGHRGFDYDQITDDIYIGTNMCCQYGFSKELLSRGVRADISLENVRVDAPKGVDFYLWLPTNNGQPPSPDDLEVGVKFLDLLVGRGIKTIVHCRLGHGRAPTLVAAYFISKGATVEEAIARISSKRPGIHLNQLQVQALEAFRARTGASQG